MSESPTPTPRGKLRVAVTGASGNIGTALLDALLSDPRVGPVTCLARRLPARPPEGTHWFAVDLADPHAGPVLTEAFRDCDAVIHLAWLIQPSRAPLLTWRTNVLGTERVLRAVAECEVPVLAYSSSVAAYSPRQRDGTDQPVAESWPTHGRPTAAYSREKAYVERLLDTFEERQPRVRVCRMRPAFVFQYAAAMEQRRLFAGPFLPHRLVRRGVVPVVPALPGLRFQAVHAADVAEAFRAALTSEARGAFNLAGNGVVGAEELAGLLGARTVRLPDAAGRSVMAAAWHLRMVPAPPRCSTRSSTFR